jgi:hypothetical protein
MTPNETPPGRLAEYLIGDLGVALRHLHRLSEGQLRPSDVVIREIKRSVETCIKRIERDMIQVLPR